MPSGFSWRPPPRNGNLSGTCGNVVTQLSPTTDRQTNVVRQCRRGTFADCFKLKYGVATRKGSLHVFRTRLLSFARTVFCRPELRRRRSRRRHMSHRRQFSIPAVRWSSRSRAGSGFAVEPRSDRSADPDPTYSERESTCAAPTRWSIRRAACCTIPADTGTPSAKPNPIDFDRRSSPTLIQSRGELRRGSAPVSAGSGRCVRPKALAQVVPTVVSLSYGNHTSQKVAAGRSFSAVSSPFRINFA